MANYIPRPDDDFDTWAANFTTYCNNHAGDLSLGPTDLGPLNIASGDWSVKFPAHVTAQNSARGARQFKDASRGNYETVIRELVGRLQVHPNVDDAEREALGITVRRTPPFAPDPAPISRPVVSINIDQRFRHGVEFADETTPTSRRKPRGVEGAELRFSIGDAPPANPEDWSFAAIDHETPYLKVFDPADAGKRCHWAARWVGNRGDFGPWSLAATAVIPG